MLLCVVNPPNTYSSFSIDNVTVTCTCALDGVPLGTDVPTSMASTASRTAAAKLGDLAIPIVTRSPVPPSEVVDIRSVEVGEIRLQHGRPRFELAATLFAPMGSGMITLQMVSLAGRRAAYSNQRS